MNYYEEIKKIIDNEIYSKESYKVKTYLEIRKLLNEANI